ncbi:MAG: amidohydrolase [Anaerolineae bacterium]|nr:amidohydrolase [Anaerolineae bacterium]
MIIDCHVHIGLPNMLARPIPPEKLARPAFQDRMENSVENQLAQMDANGVDTAIVFGFPLEEIDRARANEYVLQAAQDHPGRFIPFMLVGDDTEYWLERGAQGFKQQNILYAPERFDLMRAYAVMAEAGVPMLIHFRAGPGYSVTEQARAILQRVPKLKLIIAHMGRHTPNTDDQVEAALLGLRDAANVFFETSTVRTPAAVARAVELIGAERVIFGSDYPFNSYQDADPLAEELAVIRQANVPQEPILSGNIRRWLAV